MTCPAQITSQEEGEGKRAGKGGAGWGLLPGAAPLLTPPTQLLIQNVIQATSFSGRADKLQRAVDILYSCGHPALLWKQNIFIFINHF